MWPPSSEQWLREPESSIVWLFHLHFFCFQPCCQREWAGPKWTLYGQAWKWPWSLLSSIHGQNADVWLWLKYKAGKSHLPLHLDKEKKKAMVNIQPNCTINDWWNNSLNILHSTNFSSFDYKPQMVELYSFHETASSLVWPRIPFMYVCICFIFSLCPNPSSFFPIGVIITH